MMKNESIPGILIRGALNLIVAVGVVLLARVIYRTASGSLVVHLFPQSQDSWLASVFALSLSLPVPIHVIAVGLILQKRWLSPPLAKAAWVTVVISGCWLGVALAVRLLIL